MSAPNGYIEKHIQTVRELLLNRAELTHQTVIDAGHGWRLAAIVYELRKRNWPIATEVDGRGIAHYRLKPGWYPKEDETPKSGENGGFNGDS